MEVCLEESEKRKRGRERQKGQTKGKEEKRKDDEKRKVQEPVGYLRAFSVIIRRIIPEAGELLPQTCCNNNNNNNNNI